MHENINKCYQLQKALLKNVQEEGNATVKLEPDNNRTNLPFRLTHRKEMNQIAIKQAGLQRCITAPVLISNRAQKDTAFATQS
jgi:hypothetical protein